MQGGGLGNFAAQLDLTEQADRARLTISAAPGWGAGGVDVGGVMGGQAVRIECGSTRVAAQDALLVLDLNADGTRGAGVGKIDQAKEVVLSLWDDAGRADMETVAKARDASGNLACDTNGGGKLTAADASWGEFRIWQDGDQAGVTDAGELKTLDQMGITEIGLTYDDGTGYAQTDDDVIIEGPALHGAAATARFDPSADWASVEFYSKLRRGLSCQT